MAVMLDLPNAEICFDGAFLPVAAADLLLAQLLCEIDWQQRSITLFGKQIPQPRLVAWYGDPGASYTYSGLTWEPLAWTEALRSLKSQVETAAGSMLGRRVEFNSVLLNLYRDGQDSMGWHSDDEPELERNPEIASVSLGATRRFALQHKRRKALKHRLDLTHGSLLVMAGETQHHWRHQVAKTTKVLEPRINLTFRYVWGR
jgi:alkylated DNA repair dioxygenase AlkB